ncbi:MAG: RagB/SusD family nutrient uptake outer membrane protein [Tenuifilaceae bacterium]
MKRIHLKITILVLLVVSFACDKYLDLEPYQSISEEQSLETDANVKNALIGAYTQFDDPSIYGGNILRNAELLGGNGEILWVGTYGGPRQIFNKEVLSSNEDVRAQWVDSYQVINICNNVISALAVVDEDDQDQVEGEALFLRSLMYFDLVRFFAQQYEPSTASGLGVPLVLTPTRGINESNYPARSTIEQVYTQVITDLTRAASLLPASNGVYATRGAANALLARVYLQKGDYPNARDAANTVIGSLAYTLKTTYAAVFNNDVMSSEDIFVTEITSQDLFSSMTEFFSTPEFGGRNGDIDILSGHLNLYAAGDARLALFYFGMDAWRTGKWNNLYGVINHIRLAEMHLIRAECNQRLGTSIGDTPLNDYNAIHVRAGLVAAGTVTLDDIILERRLELAHEGFMIHDIKRLKKNVVVSGTETLPYNDNKLVFPIPAREMEANDKLVQNPGY